MAGGPLSGRYGVVNGLSAIRNWQVNDNGALAKFVNSATAIGAGRRAGVSSWSGSYSNHGGTPPVFPGTLFGFTGFTAPDDQILGHQGAKYVGNALVESVSINWDWTSGNVLENQTSFQGALGLAESTGYPVADAGVSDPEPVGPCFIEYSADNGSTWTTLQNVTQASLQMQNAVQPVVTSSTNGLTDRRAGPFDWAANITVEDTIMGSGLTKYSAYIWRFHTTATYFYLLKWGRVKEFTGLNVQPESGAIISHNIALEMSATEQIAGTPTLGQVRGPGASPYAIWN